MHSLTVPTIDLLALPLSSCHPIQRTRVGLSSSSAQSSRYSLAQPKSVRTRCQRVAVARSQVSRLYEPAPANAKSNCESVNKQGTKCATHNVVQVQMLQCQKQLSCIDCACGL